MRTRRTLSAVREGLMGLQRVSGEEGGEVRFHGVRGGGFLTLARSLPRLERHGRRGGPGDPVNSH